MKLEAYRYTNPGGRSENQDSSDFRMEADRGLFLLADGLGGHRDGAQASALVVRALLTAWEEDWSGDSGPEDPLAALLLERTLEANDLLLEARESGSSGRSTALALAVAGNRAAWVHVGDSRLYRISQGQICHATRDHSVTYKKYLAGEIGRNELNVDEDRSSLLRVVGDKTRCIPQTGGGEVRPGDAFLLCSDGLWSVLYDEEILIDCLKSDSPRAWAELLLLRALPRLGPDADNLTLLTVFLTETGHKEGPLWPYCGAPSA